MSKDEWAGLLGAFLTPFVVGYLLRPRKQQSTEMTKMEKDIVGGAIGTVGVYDLDFKGGKLSFKIGVAHLGMSVDLVLAVDADAVIDAIAAKIPGQVDDAILGVLKAALKMS